MRITKTLIRMGGCESSLGKHGILLVFSFCGTYFPGVDFTKGFKTWHKFSTEIRFMLIPILVLFIAHEFITEKF